MLQEGFRRGRPSVGLYEGKMTSIQDSNFTVIEAIINNSKLPYLPSERAPPMLPKQPETRVSYIGCRARYSEVVGLSIRQ